MTSLEPNQAHLRRYLLGELPEAERAALEERYFAEADVFAEVLAAEDELVEAYLAGALPAAERELFEQLILSTPAGRQKVGVAQDLGRRRLLARPPSKTLPARSFGIPRWAAAAAVWIVACAGLWLTRSRVLDVPTGTQGVEHRALPATPGPQASGAASPGAGRTEPSPLPAAREAVLSVTLATGLVRDASAAPAFAIPLGTTSVRLVLPIADSDYGRYRVSLQTPEGTELLSEAELAPRPLGSGRGIEVRIRRGLLEPGTYVAILSAVNAAGRTDTIGEYVFRVMRGA